jgi:hypothetical protein
VGVRAEGSTLYQMANYGPRFSTFDLHFEPNKMHG